MRLTDTVHMLTIDGNLKMKRDSRQFVKSQCVRIDNKGRLLLTSNHTSIFYTKRVGYISHVVTDSEIFINKNHVSTNKSNNFSKKGL